MAQQLNVSVDVDRALEGITLCGLLAASLMTACAPSEDPLHDAIIQTQRALIAEQRIQIATLESLASMSCPVAAIPARRVPTELVAAEDIREGDTVLISPRMRVYRQGNPIRLPHPQHLVPIQVRQ